MNFNLIKIYSDLAFKSQQREVAVMLRLCPAGVRLSQSDQSWALYSDITFLMNTDLKEKSEAVTFDVVSTVSSSCTQTEILLGWRQDSLLGYIYFVYFCGALQKLWVIFML